MKKLFFVYLIVCASGVVPWAVAQDPMEKICIQACDSLVQKKYVAANQLFENCEGSALESTYRHYKARHEECNRILYAQAQAQENKLKNNGKKNEERYLLADTSLDVAVRDSQNRQENEQGHNVEIRYRIRIDTLVHTNNKNYLHPFFIKTSKVRKSVWYGTVNGVGAAALGSSIALGIQAQNSYRKHNTYAAGTRQDHRHYYRQYRTYTGAMWGCIGLAVAAFASNFLAVQVSDEVRIIPGVAIDMQGNPQASLNIRF